MCVCVGVGVGVVRARITRKSAMLYRIVLRLASATGGRLMVMPGDHGEGVGVITVSLRKRTTNPETCGRQNSAYYIKSDSCDFEKNVD